MSFSGGPVGRSPPLRSSLHHVNGVIDNNAETNRQRLIGFYDDCIIIIINKMND